MPKTAMNKDCGLIFGKNNVWPARKRTDVQPKSKSEAVQERSNGKLRRSVAGLDPRHVPAEVRLGYPVHNLARSELKKSLQAIRAIFRASKGGTALPTC